MDIDFKKIYKDSLLFCQSNYKTELEEIINPDIFKGFNTWENDKKLKPIKNALLHFLFEHNILIEDVEDDISFKNILSSICNTRSAAKGAKSGDAFETLIERILISFNFSVKRELIHEDFSEKIDFFATNGNLNLIIMAQKDIWGGGQQTQRCRKYLDIEKLKEYNSKNYKYICLVFNEYRPPDGKYEKKLQRNEDFKLIINAYSQKNLMWLSGFVEYLKNLNQ